MAVANINVFLIVAHREVDLLTFLLRDLDDRRNIIFVHLGNEISRKDKERLIAVTHLAPLVCVPTIRVAWGGSSLIEVMMHLLRHSENYCSRHHIQPAYYHYLSGQDFPIQNQDVFHSFFTDSNSNNYLNCVPLDDSSRVDYFWFFRNVVGRNYDSFLGRIDYKLIRLQQKLGFSRAKRRPFPLYKGNNWFSIKPSLVSYIIKSKSLIKKWFYHGNVADELVVPSLAHASPLFRSTLSYDDGRLFDWERGAPYVFQADDFAAIVQSGKFFVRKCSVATVAGKRLVETLLSYHEKKLIEPLE